MTDNDKKPANSQGKGDSDTASLSGPFALQMPPDPWVWNAARRMVGDKGIRVSDFARCTTQDPVLVIELLKKSNALFFAAGRSPITSVITAIVRLGYDVVKELLELIAEREPIANEEVSHWFELYRHKGRRTSIISMIIAESIARTLSDDCQASGVLSSVGDMLAVLHFKEHYVQLAEEHSRSGINYQLAHNMRFDVEDMGLRYLRKQGLPEASLFAIDRSAQVRTPERAPMRPICFAAVEMVEAFDANRWEKLAPGRTLPPKSSLRLLQMNDSQYLKVYERAAEYLFTTRMEDEKKRREEIQKTVQSSRAQDSAPAEEKESQLSEDIELLMFGGADGGEQAEEEEISEAPPQAADQTEDDDGSEQSWTLADVKNRFSLGKGPQKTVARMRAEQPVIEAPKLRTNYGTAVVSSIANMLEEARRSEDLLMQILELLVKDKLFQKAAIIVVSKDRQYAIVVAARGPAIGNGQRLSLDDPLSPLAKCFSKVQSFGNRSNAASPFGSKAFALAPIDADHETPVALYADCGNDGSLSFEARRIFRTVVDLLNKKLPTIPGGIPVELTGE